MSPCLLGQVARARTQDSRRPLHRVEIGTADSCADAHSACGFARPLIAAWLLETIRLLDWPAAQLAALNYQMASLISGRYLSRGRAGGTQRQAARAQQAGAALPDAASQGIAGAAAQNYHTVKISPRRVAHCRSCVNHRRASN